MSNALHSAKKDTLLRRRKPSIGSAGVKHRLNCLSTLSALQPHTPSNSNRKNRSLSVAMSKPIKTSVKKRQENYVIRLGNQQLMQQFTKSGSSVVVKDEDMDPELQNLTLQQKIKVFFVLLMIPSAMVVFFGGSKFNNTSSVSIDPNIQLLGAMGGMGGAGGMAGIPGLAGLAGMAGFPKDFGGGYGGHGGHGGHGSHGRHGGYHPEDDYEERRHPHERRRRHYDPESIRDHLNRFDPIASHREEHKEKNSEPTPKQSEPPPPQSNSETKGMPHWEGMNEQNLNSGEEDIIRKLMDSHGNPYSDSMNPNFGSNENEGNNNKNSNESPNQSTESKTNVPITESTTTQKNSENSDSLKKKSEIKTILLWTPIEGLTDGSQAFIDSKCVTNKCIFTSNKSDRSQSDAIVFEGRHVTTGDLPNMRSPHQKWIFFSRHSPQSYSIENLIPLSNAFNWSWTYRSDSDIVYNYANVNQISDENNQLFKASDIFYIWRQKTKMISWFANNCKTNTKRENYVKQLIDYIDIDIYGKCSEVNKHINIEDQNEIKSLSEKYLFVIVLEGNDCKDYFNRRLFKFLEYNMIPIVMGGADYSRIVPPNSVINAKDFASAKDLADFVLDIGSDFQKYKKYFEWKRNHRISYERKDLCQLCHKLHDEDNRSNTNVDIIDWWLDSTQCK